ncbi:MAG: energy transducer TonB [Pseudomonadota bacterium]
MPSLEITANDRLSFTAVVAIALHAALILGVGFSWQLQQPSSPTIEVTLTQADDETAPAEADFIATTNQLGSGDASEVLEKTTTSEADFVANVVQDVMPEPVLVLPEDAAEELEAQLTTATSNDWSVNPDSEDPTDPQQGLNSKTIEELAREIASLEARLAEEAQQQAKGPRVRRLTSVSARRTADAAYLRSWRRKVESVGNLNYPAEARQRQLYGDLTLLVTIRPDGSLKDVRVLRSSGHSVLDDAALRIVRLAAPYPPFPVEMRRSTDLLEIVRSWQFRPRHANS